MSVIQNMNEKIQTIINDDIESMLRDISKTYKINFVELKQKYIINDIKVELPKKRGRKKKLKEEFIEAEEYIYKGETYLVDNKNLIYKNDLESPKIIGEKLVDGTIKFYKPTNIHSS
jgi:hypothetical protein